MLFFYFSNCAIRRQTKTIMVHRGDLLHTKDLRHTKDLMTRDHLILKVIITTTHIRDGEKARHLVRRITITVAEEAEITIITRLIITNTPVRRHIILTKIRITMQITITTITITRILLLLLNRPIRLPSHHHRLIHLLLLPRSHLITRHMVPTHTITKILTKITIIITITNPTITVMRIKRMRLNLIHRIQATPTMDRTADTLKTTVRPITAPITITMDQIPITITTTMAITASPRMFLNIIMLDHPAAVTPEPETLRPNPSCISQCRPPQAPKAAETTTTTTTTITKTTKVQSHLLKTIPQTMFPITRRLVVPRTATPTPGKTSSHIPTVSQHESTLEEPSHMKRVDDTGNEARLIMKRVIGNRPEEVTNKTDLHTRTNRRKHRLVSWGNIRRIHQTTKRYPRVMFWEDHYPEANVIQDLERRN